MRSARDLGAGNTNSGRQKAYPFHPRRPKHAHPILQAHKWCRQGNQAGSKAAATPGICMHPFVKVSLLIEILTLPLQR